ncbi:MAG: FAD-binding protein, partial [Deltaproteobacteria bacterium]|nr:FAD-binding protein [Deltaproteobacteria bacterium]
VLAAGSATRLFKYASANFQTTGDAQALGFRVGAPLVNMEFVEFTVIPKVAQKIISTGGISPFTGRGSHIRNGLGERIMETYDPVRLERTTRAQLVRAIDREIREGRGPIWNDSSHFTEELWQEFHTSSPEVLDRLKAAGLEYRRAPFEWVPAMHTCLGGFLIDERGETAVPGLYASGECAATIHGANRLSGNATTECLVFGKRAGRHAALFDGLYR